MKKPTKLIYLIEALNKKVYVRYIPEEYYESNKSKPGSWPVIFKDGETLYKDFVTGLAAEEFIIERQTTYQEEYKAWEETTAASRQKAVADNDNYAKMIAAETDWRVQNFNGKIFK